jgi:hypothetical protein
LPVAGAPPARSAAQLDLDPPPIRKDLGVYEQMQQSSTRLNLAADDDLEMQR